MPKPPRLLRVIPGTLPTPADPSPSNQTAYEYSDDSCRITTGPPTAQVLAEYAAAVQDHPGDAGLHLYYGIALQAAGSEADALTQFREALRLDPSSQFARSQLASALRSAGRLAEAEEESREVLRLYLSKCDGEPAQEDAILRWSLAECLHQSDKAAEAIAELEIAVSIQRAAVAALAGSPGLLRQLEELLATWRSGYCP